MKRIAFCSLALLVLIGVSSVYALPLSDTGITAGDFGTIAGAPVVAALVSLFDFDPATPGGDGAMISQVFAGIGPAAGLFVYAYQIDHFGGSSEEEVGGISFDFLTNPLLTPVAAITSYVIDGTGTGLPPAFPPPPGAPFIPGPGVSTTFAEWFAGTVDFGGSPPVPWIARGAYSDVFGTFSPNPPKVVVADVIDTGVTFASASVYSPVPEPGSIAAVSGIALLGLVGYVWRRRK